MGNWDLIPSRGKYFPFSKVSALDRGLTQCYNQQIQEALHWDKCSWGVKQITHPPPFSAKVNNAQSNTSTCPYAPTFIKHKDNFIWEDVFKFKDGKSQISTLAVNWILFLNPVKSI
jgi:hypothetical protein